MNRLDLPQRAPLTPAVPSPSLSYDPSHPDFATRAHGYYDQIRQVDPVHWSSAQQNWIITRHGDAKAALRAPDLVPFNVAAELSRREHALHQSLPALRQLAQEALLTQTGTGHVTARRLLSRVLNDRRPEDYAPAITEIVAAREAALRQAGGGDLVVEFAHAIPLHFVGQLLGIPDEDMAFMAECVADVLPFFGSLGTPLTEDQLIDLNARTALGLQHLVSLLRDRTTQPQDDGLSRILALSAGEAVPADLPELATRILFLFIAGLDTSTSFLSQAVAALLEHPTERDRWAAGRVDAAVAVEELLRFTSPAAAVTRVARVDYPADGKLIGQGQYVTIILEAANRDPAVFAEPHRLDLTRDPCPHLALGDGVHACLGGGLARLQARVALTAFAQLPALQVERPTHAPPVGPLKSIASLPFRFV